MSVTRTLQWFGRMCPRVGRARRASLQDQDASNPKSAAGVQPVSSAERCNSKTVPGGSYSLGEWVTKSSSCLFATVGPQGTQAQLSSRGFLAGDGAPRSLEVQHPRQAADPRLSPLYLVKSPGHFEHVGATNQAVLPCVSLVSCLKN